jgi:NTF2 fold immunity protein
VHTPANETAEAARATLYELMMEMNIWETEFHAKYKHDGPEKHAIAAKQSLHALAAKYFTDRERKGGRETTLHASSPPEYDPDRESMDETQVLSENKVAILTTWKHPSKPETIHHHRYSMVHKNGAWLLDRKERLSSVSQKWDLIGL